MMRKEMREAVREAVWIFIGLALVTTMFVMFCGFLAGRMVGNG